MTAAADCSLPADPCGQHVLLDGLVLMPSVISALKSESGNPALVFHGQRHGVGTGVVRLLLPTVGDVVRASPYDRRSVQALSRTPKVASLRPSKEHPANWPEYADSGWPDYADS